LSDNRPIGVFDSGVGGLTVLQSLHERLPGESTIYLGDLARCPYGVRSQEEVQAFAVQIGDLLASSDIKLLVVACNTATAAAFDVLKRRYSFPVVGVIEPGARAAVDATQNGRIGVVATEGTVASGAYTATIKHIFPRAQVVERPASWLVPLIEQGPVTRGSVSVQLEPILAGMRQEGVDSLILGCTHFPLVRDIFEAGAGAQMSVLDSAHTTAAEVARIVHGHEMEAAVAPSHRILVTGPAEAFAARAAAMFPSAPRLETVSLVLEPVS
jgi:glutamate racemase